MHPTFCRAIDAREPRLRIRVFATCFNITVLLLILLQAAEAQVPYKVTDLGSLPGGNTSQALGLNNGGEVVGVAGVAGDAEFHGFVWRLGRMIDLGTLEGPNSAGKSINNSGEVAGTAELAQTQQERPLCEEAFASGFQVCRAVFWNGEGLVDLGTLGGNSAAFGINDRHEVVGAADAADSLHAFIWRNGRLRDLGTPVGVDSAAAAINNRGQVAVNAHISRQDNPNLGEPDFHAFLWERGQFTDLGTLGGSASFANGINDEAGVVGFSCRAGDASCVAFFWQDGAMKDLGVLPGDFGSVAMGVNKCGDVVGFSVTNTGIRGFLWSKGQMHDVNTFLPPNSGWRLRSANAINDRGQIVGGGLHNGVPRGFMLTPDETNATSACEDH